MRPKTFVLALLAGLILGLSVTVGVTLYLMRTPPAESTSPAIDPLDNEMPKGGNAGADNNPRAAKFEALDLDKDGVLNLTEFAASRKPAEAEKWFKLRDANSDGVISREEFLPFSAKK